jgi:hypothetical protein
VVTPNCHPKSLALLPLAMVYSNRVALVIFWLALLLATRVEAFCAGTYYYRTANSGGIVAVPRIDSTTPTVNTALLPIPDTDDSDSGIYAQGSILCYVVVGTRAVHCLNMTSGTRASAILPEGLNPSSNSRIGFDSTTYSLYISTSAYCLAFVPFNFSGDSLQIGGFSGISTSYTSSVWALKSGSTLDTTYALAAIDGSTDSMDFYVSELGGGVSPDLGGAVAPMYEVVTMAAANDLFYYTDTQNQLWTVDSRQPTVANFRGTLPTSFIRMASTDRTCADIITVNSSLPITPAYFTPNETSSTRPVWETLVQLGSSSIQTDAWTTFTLPFQTWMVPTPTVPSPPTLTPFETTPSATSPLPPAVRSCPEPPPQPIHKFYCNAITGIWESNTTVTDVPVIIISTPVVITGDLQITTGTITFSGLGSTVNVTGCVLGLGSIVVEMTPEELQRILDSPDRSRLLVLSSCSTGTLTSVPLSLKASPKKNCQKVTATLESSQNQLFAVFRVNSSRCHRWWIILVSVIGGVVLISAVILVIFRLKHPRWQKTTRRSV